DETIDISEASGGLLYLIDSQKGRLEPHGLFLNNQEQDLEAHGIRGFDLEGPAMPHWLDLPSHGGPSQVYSFGFDQAGAYRDLLKTLESPRVHLVCTGLQNRQGITIGVLVLLHRDTGDEARPAILRPQRIAFVEAIS